MRNKLRIPLLVILIALLGAAFYFFNSSIYSIILIILSFTVGVVYKSEERQTPNLSEIEKQSQPNFYKN